MPTDWPGHYANGPDLVAALIDAGTDVNAKIHRPHTETPLHWAVSTDEVPVLDALLHIGADIETGGGGVIGTPLARAVAFEQRRPPTHRTRRVGQPVAGWLGLMDRVEAFFDNDPQPTAEVVTGAFSLASHGGQQPAADYLLDRGAELNWIGYDKLTPRVGLASVRGTT